jgi:hypothetical protein
MTERKVFQADSGALYTYDWAHTVRTEYGEFMNPASRYKKVYYQINVYDSEGEFVNFGFVNDITDTDSVIKSVKDVVEWHNAPAHMLEEMHSRFD